MCVCVCVIYIYVAIDDYFLSCHHKYGHCSLLFSSVSYLLADYVAEYDYAHLLYYHFKFCSSRVFSVQVNAVLLVVS